MRAPLCLAVRQKELCLNGAKGGNRRARTGCARAHAVRSQSHPIYLGGIVSETAPFLDAIISQAGQGLRCGAPPYIKVLPIDID